MKRFALAALMMTLASFARAGESDVVRVVGPKTPATPAPTPAPAQENVIDLFGQQPVTVAADRPALPESEKEVRRPEASAVAPAASSTESRVIDRRSRASTGWGWTDVLPLAAVLGLIALVAMVIRRFMPARGLIGQAPGLLDVVARTPVSPKQSILLVRMGRRFLLLGVSPDRISTLCVVEDAESAAELMGEVVSRRADSSTAAFHSSFKAEEAQFDDEMEHPSASSAGGHVRGLLEKVRQMKRSRVA